jgi:EmrB/QacA subfamily drug resistance transporter
MSTSSAEPISDIAPDDAPVGPDPKRWRALWVIAIAQLMIILDASIVNIALPSAQRDLGITDANRQWVVTAYTLAFGGLLLLGGRIADYSGRKKVFIIGLLGFASASALGGIAQSGTTLFAARALQGAFAALLAPAALSLITVTFTESKERARAFGVYGAISGGGAAIGLIVGGILTEYASWRWCLLVNVPIALIAAALAVPFVRESRAHGNTSYDVPGAVTATFGLVALVFGISKAGTPGIGWTAGVTVTSLVLAAILLTSFVLIETRTSNPLLPLRVVANRNRAGSYLAMFLTPMGLFGMFLFLTYYFQGTLGYSALKSGFAFLPFSLGIIVSAGIASQLLPRVGPRWLATGGLVSAALGMVWLTQITPTTSYVSNVLPAMLLISLGMGFVFVPLSATALFGIGEHDAGVGSAVLNSMQQIGGSLGAALLNTIAATATASYLVANQSPSSVQDGLVHGYTTAFWVGAFFLALAAAVVAFTITATKHSLAQHDVGVPVA